MKKKIIAVSLTSVFLLSIVGCAKQTVDFDIEKASKVTIFSGSMGQSIELTTESDIEYITKNINDLSFDKDKSSKNYDGFYCNITWYNADNEQIEKITVINESRISYDNYFYDTKGNIDLDWIDNLFYIPIPTNIRG